jgi:hypothetical protein
MQRIGISVCYIALVHTIVFSQPSRADELPDKFAFKLGSYIANSIDTDISVNPQGGLLGTNIKYSKDLGGEDKRTVPWFTGYYRFNDAHRIDFGYYKVDRSGQRTLTADLQIGDETYSATETLVSELNLAVAKAAYTYSFYHNEKVELGVSAGLHVMNYEYKVRSVNTAERTDDSFTAPLPVFGFRMNYNISPAWSSYVRSEIFYIEIDDTYKGSLVDLSFGTEYRLFENVALGIAANRMSIDAEVTEDNFRGNVIDVYKGLTIYAGLYF